MFKGLFAFLMISCSCLAGTISPGVPDERYLAYGGDYECVVQIYGQCECGKQKSAHMLSASAVVVDRRWLVTAAHVVHKSSGVRVKVRDAEHRIRRVVVNKFFEEDMLGRYDIALCESEDDMVLDFYPKIYEGSSEVGKTAGICGFGSTGTFSTGAVKSDGRRRAGSNVVQRSENHVLVCSVTDPRTTNLEFMIAPGDSGGGLFIDQKLAGINSFVSATDGKSNSDYGDECCHTRVSLFANWIKAHIRGEEPPHEVAEADPQTEAM